MCFCYIKKGKEVRILLNLTVLKSGRIKETFSLNGDTTFQVRIQKDSMQRRGKILALFRTDEKVYTVSDIEAGKVYDIPSECVGKEFSVSIVNDYPGGTSSTGFLLVRTVSSGLSSDDTDTIKQAVTDWLNANPGAVTSLSEEQKNKLKAILLDGDGSSVLSDNGSYIDFAEKVREVIDGNTVDIKDEKVKLTSSSTDAQYLENLIDNATIEVDTANNCLVVRKIDGQTVTVAEINFLTGVKSNVQEQINNLGKPMTMYGVFGTKAELIASTNPAPTDGNTAIVITDEENDNKQMTYIYIASTSTWTPVTESSIRVRDLSTEPVDLSTETTGTLPKGKIDAAIARLVDVLDKTTYRGTGDGIVKKADTLTGLTATISQLNQVIADSHIHTNKTMLDKIVSNGVGSRFLADNGEYIELLHIGTTSPPYEIQIWLDNTNSEKPILKIYDGTNWIEVVDLTDYAKKSDVPVLTDLIDDTTSSTNTVYSSNQIDEKLSDYAKTDDVEISLNNKVDKVTGKGLSTNDLTNTLKTGYDDAVTKAHEHANSNTLDKFSEDGSGMPLYDGDKFYDGLIANNLTTTEEGYALDARQGNVLDTRVTALETPTFTQATSRTNIASGNTMSTILGKIMKYFTDLKSHAFNSLANNLTTTTTGYALDATQGKALNDKFGKVLWTNSNPVAFDTMTITLSSDDYDMLDIYYLWSTTSNFISNISMLKGYSSIIRQVGFDRSAGVTVVSVISRTVNRSSDTVFTVDNFVSTDAVNYTNNYFIPIKVIGRKLS